MSGSDVPDTIFDQDLTRLEEARTYRQRHSDSHGGSSGPKELGLIKQLLESDSGKQMAGSKDLVVMDGKVKTLTPHFTEEGGKYSTYLLLPSF